MSILTGCGLRNEKPKSSKKYKTTINAEKTIDKPVVDNALATESRATEEGATVESADSFWVGDFDEIYGGYGVQQTTVFLQGIGNINVFLYSPTFLIVL